MTSVRSSAGPTTDEPTTAARDGVRGKLEPVTIPRNFAAGCGDGQVCPSPTPISARPRTLLVSHQRALYRGRDDLLEDVVIVGGVLRRRARPDDRATIFRVQANGGEDATLGVPDDLCSFGARCSSAEKAWDRRISGIGYGYRFRSGGFGGRLGGKFGFLPTPAERPSWRTSLTIPSFILLLR